MSPYMLWSTKSIDICILRVSTFYIFKISVTECLINISKVRSSIFWLPRRLGIDIS